MYIICHDHAPNYTKVNCLDNDDKSFSFVIQIAILLLWLSISMTSSTQKISSMHVDMWHSEERKEESNIPRYKNYIYVLMKNNQVRLIRNGRYVLMKNKQKARQDRLRLRACGSGRTSWALTLARLPWLSEARSRRAAWIWRTSWGQSEI